MNKLFTFDDNDYLVEIEEKRKTKYRTTYKKRGENAIDKPNKRK